MIKLIIVFLIFVSCTSLGKELRVLPMSPLNGCPWIFDVKVGPYQRLQNIDEDDRNGQKGYRFRVVTVVSEGHYSLSIDKILYGYEGCCAEINKTWDFNLHDFKKLFGLKGQNLGKKFKITKWLSPTSFEFKIQRKLFKVENLGDNILEFHLIKISN